MSPNKEELYEALRKVIDPELEYNIVDLGLVYDCEIGEEGFVQVVMTLTTPGCPMGDALTKGVEKALFRLPGVQEVAVDIVWEPSWHPGMMSEEAKTHFGFA